MAPVIAGEPVPETRSMAHAFFSTARRPFHPGTPAGVEAGEWRGLSLQRLFLAGHPL